MRKPHGVDRRFATNHLQPIQLPLRALFLCLLLPNLSRFQGVLEGDPATRHRGRERLSFSAVWMAELNVLATFSLASRWPHKLVAC